MMNDENMEYLGVAAVRFNAQGETKVLVYKDHDLRMIRMKNTDIGAEVTLSSVPPYDEEENDLLWEKINAYKQSRMTTPVERTYSGKKPSRPARRRQIILSKRPEGLSDTGPRSYKERTTSKKPLTVAEVSAIVAEELGSMLGGDE